MKGPGRPSLSRSLQARLARARTAPPARRARPRTAAAHARTAHARRRRPPSWRRLLPPRGASPAAAVPVGRGSTRGNVSLWDDTVHYFFKHYHATTVERLALRTSTVYPGEARGRGRTLLVTRGVARAGSAVWLAGFSWPIVGYCGSFLKINYVRQNKPTTTGANRYLSLLSTDQPGTRRRSLLSRGRVNRALRSLRRFSIAHV